jgi:hypothetical protein
MGHSCDKGWDTKPKLDEARIVAPEESRHRGRKNRRKWCRGKVGVEHQSELALNKNRVYMSTRYGDDHPHGARCGWRERWAWSWLDGVRCYLRQDRWFWSCAHMYSCRNCGKILGNVGRECPEFHPHERDWKRRGI